jgi:hypothetical protein
MKKIFTTLVAVIAIVQFSYSQSWSGNGTDLYFNTGGKVGIGTTTPKTTLQLGDASTGVLDNTGELTLAKTVGGGHRKFKLGLDSNYGLSIGDYGTNASDAYSPYITIQYSGYVGIGTVAPDRKLDVVGAGAPATGTAYFNSASYQDHINYKGVEFGYDSSGQIGIIAGASGGTASNLAFWTYNGAGSWLERLRIDANGYVGIGTISPDEKLTVKGKIHAEEVKIDLSVPYPDYVFKPTYRLPTLLEVKTYINKYHRLPDMPSEAVVTKNGLNLGETNALLTKKVEELTLYLIEKDSELKKQKAVNKQQEQRLKRIEATLKTLTFNK